MRSVLESYQQQNHQPPTYYIEAWTKAGLNPNSQSPPVFVKLDIPGHLPEEFALYLRGTFAYHAGELTEAKVCWGKLLQLPLAQRQYRSTWAAFMLGKVALQENPQDAGPCFQLVRAMARSGFADSLGLASSSLGWEALACLRQKQYDRAIALYLAQYATGDTTAVASLQFTVRAAIQSQMLHTLASDETSRNVVTAYLLSHGGPFYPTPSIADMKTWLQAVEKSNINQLAEADRLAWAAYQAGDTQQAARWLHVANPNALMTHWITAKLLLRQGKVVEAAEHLRIITRQLPLAQTEQAVGPVYGDMRWALADSPLQEKVRGELGTLLLARQQYVQALDVLLKGGLWEDAAYVAERVLTADELKRYVDDHWPQPQMHVASDKTITPPWMGDRLRYLLARRLTRVGRWKESRSYYPSKWQTKLDAYIGAIRRGHDHDLSDRQRAAAFWEAGSIARHEGLELLGYELAPDCLVYDGSFPGPAMTDERMKAIKDNPLTALSQDEINRAKVNIPPINKRWHYRYIAAEHTWQAIALMPDNNDLTAQMFWVAGSWLKDTAPKTADRFYKALVQRCGQTKLGQQADQQHWFPKVEIDETALLKKLVQQP
jgi:hypothetical protein